MSDTDDELSARERAELADAAVYQQGFTEGRAYERAAARTESHGPRRERIATAVLAGMLSASPADFPLQRTAAFTALTYADALIQELDRAHD